MNTVALDFWQHQHERFQGGDDAWCRHYWQTWSAPYRWRICEAVKHLQAEDAFELGCHCGVQLYALQRMDPNMILGGVDVNPAATAWGRRQWDDLRQPRVALMDGEFLHGLARWGRTDVVLSCYALAYCLPEALPEVISAAWRQATHGLVIAEPSATGAPRLLHPGTGEWAHDWPAVFAQAGIRAAAVQADLLDSNSNLNRLWTVTKDQA